jgi:endogenous inhibitor of DNA gyrase (YacG/DUF329 family)
MAMEFKCPICEKAIPSATSGPDGCKQMNARFFPFCSERCRLVDLGAWLDGDYRFPAGQPTLDELPHDEE